MFVTSCLGRSVVQCPALPTPVRQSAGLLQGSLCVGVSAVSTQAFDGSAATKWLDFGAAGGGSAWLEYRLPPSSAPAAVLRYALTSADDAPERDPRDWALEGRPADDEAGSADAGALLMCMHHDHQQHRPPVSAPLSFKPHFHARVCPL